MDLNCSLLEHLVQARLDEARARQARAALLASARPPRPPLRVALGSP